jgi:hypothetical protein
VKQIRLMGYFCHVMALTVIALVPFMDSVIGLRLNLILWVCCAMFSQYTSDRWYKLYMEARFGVKE